MADTGVTRAPGRSGPPRLAAAALARVPVTAAVLVALWLTGAVTGSLWSGPAPGLLAAVGAGDGALDRGHWWVLLTSAFWTPDVAALLAATVVVAVLLGVTERTLGSARTAAVALLVQVAGTAVGIGLAATLAAGGSRWGVRLDGAVAVGPTPAAVGCALAASAAMPALWRRRLRLVLLVGLLMLVLYSGLLADVLRLTCGGVGLAAGALWFGRARRAGAAEPAVPAAPSRHETRVLVALVVAASAVGPLIAVVAETRIGPLSVLRFVFASPPPDAATVAGLCADPAAARECTELQAQLRLWGTGPAVMSVVPVLLLLVSAEGLRRGRRAAWVAALALNAVLAGLGAYLAAVTAVTPAEQRIVLGPGTHLHEGLELGLPALQPVAVALLLVATRSRFAARAEPRTYRRWVRTLAAAALGTAAVYVGGSLLVADRYVPPPDLPALLADLPARYLPPGYLGQVEPAFLPQGVAATLLFEWTGIVFWSVALVAGLATFARAAPAGAGSDRARIRALLGRTGGSSLAHMATWPGHSYLFTTTEDGAGGEDGGGDLAAIAYRVIGGVALTTGEPIGDPRHRERAVRGFAERCERSGWTPCLYSVGDATAALVRGWGWSSVQVAEETVVPLPGLAFTGKKWQDVRSALNRAGQAGVTAEWTTWRAAPLAVLDQIRTISEEWVADKGLPEMGFTLGGLDELDDEDVRLLVALDPAGVVHGVTSWLPVRRDGAVVGWTLDFMRRRAGGLRGVMEFLIASAAKDAQADGAEFLSLSGAPLARLDRGEPAAGLQRVLDVAGRSLEPVYGFRSLLAFKAKFQPEYRPLHMAYPDPVALPAIGRAIGRAYLPDVRIGQVARLLRTVAR